jgi:hypothetical protein
VLLAGNYSNNLSVAKALDAVWSPQYIFAELLHNPKFRESCLGRPLVVQQPAPWTDWTLMRSVTRAGFRGIEAGKMAGSLAVANEAVKYCVVSPMLWQGRQGYLFGVFIGGKDLTALNSTGISFIYPVVAGEEIFQISFAQGCKGESVQMQKIYRHQGRWTDYLIFDYAPHTRAIRHTQTGISFECIAN